MSLRYILLRRIMKIKGIHCVIISKDCIKVKVVLIANFASVLKTELM